MNTDANAINNANEAEENAILRAHQAAKARDTRPGDGYRIAIVQGWEDGIDDPKRVTADNVDEILAEWADPDGDHDTWLHANALGQL